MGYSFTLTDIIPAPPAAVYDAWLNSRAHSEMTGSKASQSARIGAKVSAWGGYITGQISNWFRAGASCSHGARPSSPTTTPIQKLPLRSIRYPAARTSRFATARSPTATRAMSKAAGRPTISHR